MQSTATRLPDLATLPLAEGKRNSPKSCSTVYRLPLEKSVPAQRLGGLVLGCLVRAITGKSNVVVGMPLDCIDALTIDNFLQQQRARRRALPQETKQRYTGRFTGHGGAAAAASLLPRDCGSSAVQTPQLTRGGTGGQAAPQRRGPPRAAAGRGAEALFGRPRPSALGPSALGPAASGSGGRSPLQAPRSSEARGGAPRPGGGPARGRPRASPGRLRGRSGPSPQPPAAPTGGLPTSLASLAPATPPEA